jgi:hypothetical protein
MKKLLLIFGGIAGFSALYSQTLSPQVIASGGTSLSNVNASMEYTIGEVATATLIPGTTGLTQGFHQPEIIIEAKETFIDVYTIQLFPNPTEQFVTVETNSDEMLQLHVYDALGQSVMDSEVFTRKTVLDVQKIANGPYLMSITKVTGEQVKTYSVIKRSTF